MPVQTYTGTSEKGDFHEALQNAIATAKETIPTDLVRWKLEEVRGENGGYILKNDLLVFIQVEVPSK